jgi:hypothetical protein
MRFQSIPAVLLGSNLLKLTLCAIIAGYILISVGKAND